MNGMLADLAPDGVEAWDLPDEPGVGLLIWATSLFWLASVIFWVWMAVHCYRYEPDRSFWMWIMVFFPPASLVYFLTRWLPASNSELPHSLRRLTRRRELARLETATLQIGNPYHFIQYGDALRDVGETARAAAAYQSALAADPKIPQALWGVALCHLDLREFTLARERLETLLALDAGYKFGDVSLAYGRLLGEIGERPAARDHLERHVVRWRTPEALYLLATLQADLGDVTAARQSLQALLMDVRSCPDGLARRYRHWHGKATKRLRQLSNGTPNR